MLSSRILTVFSFTSLIAIIAGSFPTTETINTTSLAVFPPLCSPAEAGRPILEVAQCRASLEDFVRVHRLLAEWVFTRDQARVRTPGYITVPLFISINECLIIFDIPQTQECVAKIATIIRATRWMIDECVGQWIRGYNGGIIFAPATAPQGAIISIFITGSRVGGNATLARSEALKSQAAAIQSWQDTNTSNIALE